MPLPDLFERGSLGSDWEVVAGGTPTISGGRVQSSAHSTENMIQWTTPMSSNLHYASATFDVDDTNGGASGPMIRMPDGVNTGYELQWIGDNWGGPGVRMVRVEASAETVVGTGFSLPNVPDTYELKIASDGNDIIGFVDGVEVIRTPDTLGPGNYVGYRIYDNNPRGQFLEAFDAGTYEPDYVYFADNFNRATAAAGPNWLGTAGGTPQVRSNRLEAEFNFTAGSFVSEIECATRVPFCQADITIPADQQFEGLILCSDGTASTGYQLQRFTFGGGFQVNRNGSYWAGGTSASAIGTYTYRGEIENNGDGTVDVVFYQGSVEVFRQTDSAPLTGKFCGAALGNFSTGCYLDNWSHGDLVDRKPTLGNAQYSAIETPTVNKPNDLEDGDHVLIFNYIDDVPSDTAANYSITGFTQVGFYASWFDKTFGLYIKYVPDAAAEPSTYTLTTPAFNNARLVAVSLKGAYAQDPIGDLIVHDGGGDGSMVFPSLTPDFGNSLQAAFYGGYAFDITAFTPPSGWTVEAFSGSASIAVGASSRNEPVALPTGTATITCNDTFAKVGGVHAVFTSDRVEVRGNWTADGTDDGHTLSLTGTGAQAGDRVIFVMSSEAVAGLQMASVPAGVTKVGGGPIGPPILLDPSGPLEDMQYWAFETVLESGFSNTWVFTVDGFTYSNYNVVVLKGSDNHVTFEAGMYQSVDGEQSRIPGFTLSEGDQALAFVCSYASGRLDTNEWPPGWTTFQGFAHTGSSKVSQTGLDSDVSWISMVLLAAPGVLEEAEPPPEGEDHVVTASGTGTSSGSAVIDLTADLILAASGASQTDGSAEIAISNPVTPADYFGQGALAAQASGTTITAALPASTTAGMVAVVAFFANAATTFSTPSGWSVLGTALNNANFSAAFFQKRLTGGDANPATTTSVTLSTTIGGYGRVYAWSSVGGGATPLEDIGHAGAPTTSSTPQTAAVTTDGPMRQVVAIACVDDDNTWSSGMPPASWANIGTRASSATGGDGMIDAIQRMVPVTGTTISATTIGTMNAADYWRTITFAVVPGRLPTSGAGTGQSGGSAAINLEVIEGEDHAVTASGSGTSTGSAAIGRAMPMSASGVGAGSGVYFEDNFNRANGFLAGTNGWVQVTGTTGDHTITSNTVTLDNSGFVGTRQTVQTDTPDQFMEATVNLLGEDNQEIGFWLRNDGAQNGYFVVYGRFSPAAAAVNLYRADAGSFTEIDVASGVPSTGAQTFRAEAEGTTIRGYLNGTLVVEATGQSAHATNRYFGLEGYRGPGGSSVTLDNLVAGDLVSVPSPVVESSTVQATDTKTISKPSGIVAGDKITIGVYCYPASPSDQTPAISGFTLRHQFEPSGSGGECNIYVFDRDADGSEGSTFTVTGITGGVFTEMVALRITGAGDFHLGGNSNGDGTTSGNLQDLTVGEDASLALGFVAGYSSSRTITAPPAGWTQVANFDTSQYVYRRDVPLAGVVADTAFTWSGSEQWSTVTFYYEPIAPEPSDETIIENFALPANGTAAHTVNFSPAAEGAFLMMLVAGQVTHDATGWTKGASAVDSDELCVLYKTATEGESSAVITHNSSNYPIGVSVIQFPGGGSYVDGVSAVTAYTAANPTLSGLTPDEDLWVFGAGVQPNSNFTDPDWNAPNIEGWFNAQTGTFPYSFFWCYQEGYGSTTYTPDPDGTSGSGSNTERITFAALKVPAVVGGGGGTGGSAVIDLISGMSASGTGTSTGSAAINRSIPFSAAGTGTFDGSVAIVLENDSVQYPMAASGTGTFGGSVIFGGITMSASGTGQTAGAAALTSIMPATAAGTGQTAGAAAIGRQSIMSAAGTGQTAGAVPLRLSQKVTAAGTGLSGGSAAFTGQTMSASGTGLTGGSVVLTIPRPVTASGTGVSAGSAAITISTGPVNHQLVGQGSGITGGSVALIATLTLTASGSGITGGSVALRSTLPIAAGGSGASGGSAAIARWMPLVAQGDGQTAGAVALRQSSVLSASGVSTFTGHVEILIPGAPLPITASGTGTFLGAAAIVIQPVLKDVNVTIAGLRGGDSFNIDEMVAAERFQVGGFSATTYVEQMADGALVAAMRAESPFEVADMAPGAVIGDMETVERVTIGGFTAPSLVEAMREV